MCPVLQIRQLNHLCSFQFPFFFIFPYSRIPFPMVCKWPRPSSLPRSNPSFFFPLFPFCLIHLRLSLRACVLLRAPRIALRRSLSGLFFSFLRHARLHLPAMEFSPPACVCLRARARAARQRTRELDRSEPTPPNHNAKYKNEKEPVASANMMETCTRGRDVLFVGCVTGCRSDSDRDCIKALNARRGIHEVSCGHKSDYKKLKKKIECWSMM